MHYSTLQLLVRKTEECYLLAKTWKISYLGLLYTLLFLNSSYLQWKLKWNPSKLYKTPTFSDFFLNFVHRAICYFNNFLYPPISVPAKTRKGYKLLTWPKFRKIFRQYSVKCSALSRGQGFKLSQCFNWCSLENKNGCCRYQDTEGANRLCSLFP